jgi:hypothetical protein
MFIFLIWELYSIQALRSAANNGDLAAVKTCLAGGANVNCTGEVIYTCNCI